MDIRKWQVGDRFDIRGDDGWVKETGVVYEVKDDKISVSIFGVGNTYDSGNTPNKEWVDIKKIEHFEFTYNPNITVIKYLDGYVPF